MPYISELLNNTITDNTDATVGKLLDIVIIPKDGTFPPLEFLVVKSGFNKNISYVPYDAVANFTSSSITLKNQFSKTSLHELPQKPFVYLKRDVLDKQIVDLVGTRVVRVNDLRIGIFDNKMCVLAIDASVRGLLRRLAFYGKIWEKFFRVQLIDWRQAQLVANQGPVQLNTAIENLSQLHPADLANIVEDLDVNYGSRLLASLDSAEAAKVLEELDPELQTILVKNLGPERAGKILRQMSSDEFVDLVKTFSEPEARVFLSQVGGSKEAKLEKLIDYPDNTAGGLMTLDFVNARPSWSVEKVIEEIRKISDSIRSLAHIYVTEEDGRFVGAVSLRRVLLAQKNMLMKDMAKGLASHSTLRPNDKVEKIIKLMTKYNLYTAAVVDKDKKLLGVVTIDDIMRQLFPSA